MFYEISNKIKVLVNNRTLFILSIALGSLFLMTGNGFAQSTQPTPKPADDYEVGGYKLTSNVELGYRYTDITGNADKYRSDLFYKKGFRVFDSSFLMEGKEAKNGLFDSFLVKTTGFGADPSGSLRVNMERTGFYRFNANVRRVKYFNSLNNHALGEHTRNTKHNFGDFDLTLLPQNEKFRVNLGMSFDRNNGPGLWTVRAYSDEFAVNNDYDTKSNDFRIGVDTKLLGFNLSLTQGFRFFKDNSNYNITVPNAGNNPTNTSVITTYNRAFPTTGNTYYTQFAAHRTFAKVLDFTANVVYSLAKSENRMLEVITGRDASNNFIDLDKFEIAGDTSRPQTRGDFGITWLATQKLRISNTFTFDKFAINGGENYLESLFRRNAAGSPLATTFTKQTYYRVTDFRRFVNTLEADYQFNQAVAAHAGYRFTSRRADISGYNYTLTSPTTATNPALIAEDENNQTNTLIAGMKIKPIKNWVIFWDVERGTADNVFSRVENYKFINFRVRSRLSFNKFGLNVSAISKDNTNPTITDEVPPRGFGADINNRIYSGSFDWNPISELSFSTGYTYQHLTSSTSIIYPLTTRIQGESKFFVRDHYAFVDVSARPMKRLGIFASYRISDDKGQDQFATVPQNIYTSYPLKFQSPEVRVSFRITKNIDWNFGYQYYDYKEKFQTLQDYKAHLPYTSLKIYFGGGER
ncbi:MAG TPA: hypothetical protein PKY59_11695 [Pyrinomonadaceae bacterium]|nr:hypothetical protein [Pyrinomonadaceae bacterium]